MSDWIEEELRHTQMSDLRLRKRLAKLVETLSKSPEKSIPASCVTWSETIGAYRFLDNPSVTPEDILSGHREALYDRTKQEDVVIVAQDTTFITHLIDNGDKGYGTITASDTEQYLLHPAVVFNDRGVNLGVMGADFWQRGESLDREVRRRQPIEEKESYRWLEGYDCACELQNQAPETLVISVGDRESDIHELYDYAQLQALSRRAEFIVRAKLNRRIEKKDGEIDYLWEVMAASQSLGRHTFMTPRTRRKAPRKVSVDLFVETVTLLGRENDGKNPVTLYAVFAKEQRPPTGEEGVEWMLLTSLPVEDFNTAQTIVGWYKQRWEIEIYFRLLKQGCKIAKLRLETQARLHNAISVYLIVAWRLHFITMMSRDYPEIAADYIYSAREWQTIYTMCLKKKPPKHPPSIRETTRMLARLGGFLARKHDGEPGIQTLWIGYQKLANYIEAFEFAGVFDE